MHPKKLHKKRLLFDVKLILNAKPPKFASARVAKIMTIFWRKTLILNAKTPNFGSTRIAQIMTNLWPKALILNAKTLKFAPAQVAQTRSPGEAWSIFFRASRDPKGETPIRVATSIRYGYKFIKSGPLKT